MSGDHADDDGNHVADRTDRERALDELNALSVIGPDDPEDPVYRRTGDHEPPRWPDPSPEALAALHAAALDIESEWFALAAEPIIATDGEQS